VETNIDQNVQLS